jgi:hypothetical protein
MRFDAPRPDSSWGMIVCYAEQRLIGIDADRTIHFIQRSPVRHLDP